MIRPVLEELVDQIAIGAMQFDAVEAGPFRILGRAFVVRDDVGDFRDVERARRRGVGEAAFHEGLRPRRDRRGRHRSLSARLQRRVRHAPDVPELDDDLAAGRVHRVGDLAPAFDLRVGIDSRRPQIALALPRDL